MSALTLDKILASAKLVEGEYPSTKALVYNPTIQ
jgi:hypothetical protein